MTDQRTAAQMALDALNEIHTGNMTPMAEESWNKAIEALRAALAQGEQEPVAWWHDRGEFVDLNVSGQGRPLYFAPPQREWQGLTDEDIEAAFMANTCCDDLVVFEHVARTIEAKLKEKNGY